MRIIGLDPGLRHTGWGIIDKAGNSYTFVAAGTINPDTDMTLGERLADLHNNLNAVFDRFKPQGAAIEETFVNQNPRSALKLGGARGVVLCVPALHHIPIAEYAPNQIKKTIVGVGHADKSQVDLMVRQLLRGLPADIPPDAADALAMALCYGLMG